MAFVLAFSAQAETPSNKLTITLKGEPDKLLTKLSNVLEDNNYDVFEFNKDMYKLKAKGKQTIPLKIKSWSCNSNFVVECRIKQDDSKLTLSIITGLHNDCESWFTGNKAVWDNMTPGEIAQDSSTEIVAKEVQKIKTSIETEFAKDLVNASQSDNPNLSSASVAATK